LGCDAWVGWILIQAFGRVVVSHNTFYMLIRIIDPFWTKRTSLQSAASVRKIFKPPIATLRYTENSTTRLWSPRINVEPEKPVSQSLASTKVVVDTAVKTSNEYVESAEEGKTASTEFSTKCSRPIACDDIRSCFPAQCPTGGSSPPPIRQTALPTQAYRGGPCRGSRYSGPCYTSTMLIRHKHTLC